MYDRLGRAALRFSLVYVRRRYRRELRVAAGAAGVLALLAAWRFARHVPEG